MPACIVCFVFLALLTAWTAAAEGQCLQNTPVWHQNGSCVPPRPRADARKGPFCYVPTYLSPPAQAFLKQAHVLGALAVPEEQGDVAAARAFFLQAVLSGLSDMDVTEYISHQRNVTLGGVPSVIATPLGTDPSSHLPGDGSSPKGMAMFWVHGGGYFIGSCYTKQLLTVAGVAKAGGITIVCPEYRLAPEHPFPAALDDVLAAYTALVQWWPANKVALIGDSAGGGLALALLLRLRQESVALPAAVGLLSPWTDLTASGDTSYTLVAVDPIQDGSDNSLQLAYVAGNTTQLTHPLVSPLFGNYTRAAVGDLPPILIQVGLRDLLLSDSVNLYRKLRRAGQSVSISPWEGMWHVFPGYLRIPEAQEAGQEMAAFLSAAMQDMRGAALA